MNQPTTFSQITNTILMVRPNAFGYNEQTAENNLYQQYPSDVSELMIHDKARNEFEWFYASLGKAGIDVIVIDDNRQTDTPDAVFPNNWVSFHEDGRVGLYPMWAPNRRLERRREILTSLEEFHGFQISEVVDYTSYENEGKFLEGTGSLVLDRTHRVAYACISPRTHPELVQKFCDDFGYTSMIFHAYQELKGERYEIYHTNVMMNIGENIAVICADAIKDRAEREKVLHSLEATGREIVLLSEEQNSHFAGNMLQVYAKQEEKLQEILVMSEQAYQSLSTEQIEQIKTTTDILYSNLDTIETYGGGSARCMMAEIFLPKKS